MPTEYHWFTTTTTSWFTTTTTSASIMSTPVNASSCTPVNTSSYYTGTGWISAGFAIAPGRNRDGARLPASAVEVQAEQLLIGTLNEAQKKQWREQKFIEVKGERTGRKYRLCRGRIGNILQRELVEGRERNVASYCIHFQNPLIPTEDQILAQKLMLETDENAFLRIANRTALIGL